MLAGHSSECARVEAVQFQYALPSPNYLGLAKVIVLHLLRYPKCYIGISSSLSWRMRHCQGHGRRSEYEGMQAHENRGFHIMICLTVGSGTTMAFWERLLIEYSQDSRLAHLLSNAASYRKGPVKMSQISFLYIVCSNER